MSRRSSSVISNESIIISGLYTSGRLEDLHARLDEAYNTLMDASKRKAYDQQLFPDGVPSQSIRQKMDSTPLAQLLFG